MITDEAKKARNEYLKAWRKRNKEKMREYNERYWQKKAENGGSENGVGDS